MEEARLLVPIGGHMAKKCQPISAWYWETATLTAGSEIVSLDNPTIVDLQWIPVDMTGSIYAHYALITIDVI